MNMNIHITPDLGVGGYAIAEAARYLHIGPGRLRAWFVTESGTPSAFLSDFAPVDGSRSISFFDLIDAQVAVQLRAMGISMQRIRRVYDAMTRAFELRHPFCSRLLFTDGKDVFLKSAESAEDSSFIEILSRQHYFKNVLEPFLKHIDYDEAHGLAQRWHIYSNVVIDPRVSFGKPVLEGSRISTYTIAREFLANNKDASFVANLYDISEAQVHSAFEFERSVKHLKVA